MDSRSRVTDEAVFSKLVCIYQIACHADYKGINTRESNCVALFQTIWRNSKNKTCALDRRSNHVACGAKLWFSPLNGRFFMQEHPFCF